jgi:hypothetical protein
MRALLIFFLALSFGGQIAVAQQTREYPLVVRADAPSYPPLARMARITGKIEAAFSVRGGEVITAEAKSGHPLLVKATVENIRSWHFPPQVSGSFATVFEYRLKGKETPSMQNPKVEMQLPIFVTITATPTRPSSNDSEPVAGPDSAVKPVRRDE